MTTATAGEPPLVLEAISKKFSQGNAQVEAIKAVSLTIQRGEFVAVMGASGSGKSTLLHVMAGLTRPTTGKVLVSGQDLASFSDRRLTQFRRQHIGLVFQSFNLIPSLTSLENVLLPLYAGGDSTSEIEQKAEALLARLGLTARKSHRPDAMSGGEQQRVAIARSLISDPDIVLADEPTGSLDSVTGQALCKLLKELCEEQGRTIVVVTHEPAVAVWAKRVLVMKDGRLLTEFGTSEFHDAHRLAAHYQDLVNAPQAVGASS